MRSILAAEGRAPLLPSCVSGPGLLRNLCGDATTLPRERAEGQRCDLVPVDGVYPAVELCVGAFPEPLFGVTCSHREWWPCCQQLTREAQLCAYLRERLSFP